MPRKRWTAAESQRLRALYAHAAMADICAELNATPRQVYTHAESLDLKRPPDWRSTQAGCALLRPENQEAVRRSHFKVGIAPSDGQHPNSVAWRFTAEQLRGRGHPIGAEVKRGGIWRRKVRMTGERGKDWRPVHVLNWEAVHGPVPPGHNLFFRDGNADNTAVENLECLPLADAMARNTSGRYPPELRSVIAVKGKLTRTINQLKKNHDRT